MNIEPVMVSSILVYSMAVTLIANWLVSGFARPRLPARVTVHGIVFVLVNLLWIALVCIFGLLAIRYVERMTNVLFGYLLFATLGFLLSLIHAHLLRRFHAWNNTRQLFDWTASASVVGHNLTYLLFASVLYLAILGLVRQPLQPVLLIPLCIGALLPDLDSRESPLGRLVPWISRRLEGRLGHREAWHTPAAAALVALSTAPLIIFFGVQTWYLIPFGFLTHLLLDMLSPRGIMILWPLRYTRYGMLGGVVQSPGCQAERVIAASMAITGLILLMVNAGRAEPSPAPVPSYKQTIERYYSMRGRTQVFAYIEGSWQISGRPISGRFEILNASDQSFVLLDRYTGEIFTGGQTSDDNIFLNRVTLQSGPPVLVKPVEIHLEHQPLGDALGIIYEMQKEPGLQHIYITGELLLASLGNTANSSLQASQGQTTLRQIQEKEIGRYSLSYLPAAELIDLADLQVETADLVIVSTSTRPATGPTVTPLPTVGQTSTEPVR